MKDWEGKPYYADLEAQFTVILGNFLAALSAMGNACREMLKFFRLADADKGLFFAPDLKCSPDGRAASSRFLQPLGPESMVGAQPVERLPPPAGLLFGGNGRGIRAGASQGGNAGGLQTMPGLGGFRESWPAANALA